MFQAMRFVVRLRSLRSAVITSGLLAVRLFGADCGITFAVVDDDGMTVPFAVEQMTNRMTNRKIVAPATVGGSSKFVPLQCGTYEYGLRVAPDRNQPGSVQISGVVEVDSDNILVFRAYREVVVRTSDGTRVYISKGFSNRRTLSGRIHGIDSSEGVLRVQLLDLSGECLVQVVADVSGDFYTTRTLPGKFVVLVYQGVRLIYAKVETSTPERVPRLEIQP